MWIQLLFTLMIYHLIFYLISQKKTYLLIENSDTFIEFLWVWRYSLQSRNKEWDITDNIEENRKVNLENAMKLDSLSGSGSFAFDIKQTAQERTIKEN